MPFDAPEPSKAAHSAEVRHHDAYQDAADFLSSEAAKLSLTKQSQPERMEQFLRDKALGELTDQGQIQHLTLPANWIEAPRKEFGGGIGTRSLRVFHPPDAADANASQAKLCFFYRGLPQSDIGAGIFKSILDKPEHPLSEAEISALSETLQERGNPEVVQLLSARTEDLNGKRVLRIEGHYKDLQSDLQEVFINADGTGHVVQELYFRAPQDQYVLYVNAAKDAMNSVKWK